jgi:hypothetical protein
MRRLDEEDAVLPLLMVLAAVETGAALPPRFDPGKWHLKIVKSDKAVKALLVGNWITTETFAAKTKYRVSICFSRSGVTYNDNGDTPIGGSYFIKDGVIRNSRGSTRDLRLARDTVGNHYLVGHYSASLIVNVRSCA